MVDLAASSHLTVSLGSGGPGLGTMWGEQTAVAILHEAGFADVAIERVAAGFLNEYFIATKT